MAATTNDPTQPRCSTGVDGLDTILGGGFPRDRIYLVQGSPGVGKTTLALQFLLEGARIGEASLYITLSETKDELDGVARSHGWNLDGALTLFELSAMEDKLKGETESTFFHPSEVELNRTTEVILGEIERVNPSRLVFDSLSEMRMLAESPLRYRRQILRLKQFLAGRKCTVLFLDDCGSNDHDVQSIVHGVVNLTRRSPEFGAARRQVNIQKIRGVKFVEGNHDYNVETGGMVVFPRLVANTHRTDFEQGQLKTGNIALDKLLGGGIDFGTSTMLMGPPGCGKSTLATMVSFVAAERGQTVLFFSFDEISTTLLSRAAQLGMDLTKHVESGHVRLEQIDPAEVSPGELADRIRRATLEKKAHVVVIDSINGYLNAMPEERHLVLQLHELLAFLNQQGVITLMVLAQQGVVGQMHSSVDLTYLADTVVLLRYFEAQGAIHQAISVMKKRSGNHERTIREFSVGPGGVEVGEPLTNMHGILTGIPIISKSAQPERKPEEA
ncbi:circadian clock protein KaiC [Nibricoccus aquaticus]|uniref:non-specific serine/threonine protein kinase n=1 Tax=Nibricoccus aquaticus TaxID=2576891 RepID=A0A290QIF3_9BACT|nr:ATPase domain-containing protein [Nibricoccus aquaticus]ATC64121.1 circadian clock protein KaiC [Nibricoccus aquaticus]